MTSGRLNLVGFSYATLDGEGEKTDRQGKATGEKVPMKIIAIKDAHGHLEVFLTFTAEEFEQFVANLQGNRIVPASLGMFKRNGQPLG